MEYINIWIVVGAALLGGLTPGPATLAIAGTSLHRGRKVGLALAWGVTSGAIVWAIFAALGIGSVLAANQWLIEIIRYAGAAYLLWLGWKSAKMALTEKELVPTDVGANTLFVAWIKGALIHLTNPKAVIFWGSILAIGLKPNAPHTSIVWIIIICMLINIVLVTSYALLFSSSSLTQKYLRLRRWFESLFAVFFFGAAAKLLTNRAD